MSLTVATQVPQEGEGSVRDRRVGVFIFRLSRDGDHEILLGTRPSDPSSDLRLPTREALPDQHDAHAVRCLTETIFKIDTTSEDVAMRKSLIYTSDRRRLRVFFMRSTPEWDAVATDGVVRQERIFKFVRLSEIETRKIFIMPGIELDKTMVEERLMQFIVVIEPSLESGVIPGPTLNGTWCF